MSKSKVSFKDHFSGHAAAYAAARPGYPDGLFSFLAAMSPAQDLAWDCATGNGQAAVGLATYFSRVIATDASSGQIDAAQAHPTIDYRVAPAENAALVAGSVDLITVAQALHWFSVAEFFASCKQALKPEGLLAVWCYGQCTVTPAVDDLVAKLYSGTLDNYWPEERRLVEQGYSSVVFPFSRVKQIPKFAMRVTWTAAQFLDYLSSWSASQRYLADKGSDPVAAIADELHLAWGEPLEKPVSWPLTLIVCRK